MMTCKRCGGNDSHKNGMMNGKQRYRCKICGFNYTTGFRGKPLEVRQQALKLYLEGLGFRAIGRILGVSNVTVLNWVRAYGLRSRPGQAPLSPENGELAPPLATVAAIADPAASLREAGPGE
ncbi:MAG: transposase-like zinc-binding domain-containing protein [Adhaeribacter sp.]